MQQNAVSLANFAKMILKTGSPLISIPANVDPTQRRFLEAIRFSVQFADVAFLRLMDGIRAHPPNTPMAGVTSTALFLDAWTVVDCANRLRGLFEHLPRLKKRDHPEIRAFVESAKNAEILRHSVQHLNTDIASLVEQNLPVFGSLSWLRPSADAKGYYWAETLLSGEFTGSSPRTRIEVKGDTSEVSDVTLWASATSVNLQATHAAIAKVSAYLEGAITFDPGVAATPAVDTYMAILFELMSPAPSLGEVG